MPGAPLVAVVGTSRPNGSGDAHEDTCRELGAGLPTDLVRLATGACGGFPDLLGGAFHAAGGVVIGYRPGEDLDDHVGRWTSPTEGYSELRFGFGGLIEREVAMIRDAELVVVLGGNVGTLSELCMAVKMERPLLIVDDLPGIGPRFPELLGELNPYPEPRVERVSPGDFRTRLLGQLRQAAA
jgi:hypothetical protein